MAKKRGNNEGTIVKRSDGRWVASITIGRDPTTGKPKRAWFYGKTRKEAAEKLAKALREKQQGTFVSPHKLTVGTWLDTWLWEYKKPRLRPITFDSYEMLVRHHLKPSLGHIALRDLPPEHVQRFYNERKKLGLSARTVRYLHTVLHGALTQAEKNQLVARNVSKLTERPPEERKDMHTYTMDQVAEQLLPAIKDERLFAVILLAFMTGLRRGELLALRWRDIDLEKDILRVRQTLVRAKDHEIGKSRLIFQEPKTQKSRRTIPIPDQCITALKRYKVQQAQEKLLLGQAYEDHGLVFCQPDGKPIDPRNFARYFDKLIKQAGLPKISPHDARHTFATLMMELGESPKTVQEMLGHSRVAITLDIYSHVSLELEKKAAARLNAALTGRK
ncbi:MAG: site-specific integrase [bacterium]|nr:site-specific integrase [bacterium]